MVARYERRPVRNDDCTDDQAGSRDLVAVHRPSSVQGQSPGRTTLDYEWYMSRAERSRRHWPQAAESTGRPESLTAVPGGGWPGPEPCYHAMVTEGAVASR